MSSGAAVWRPLSMSVRRRRLALSSQIGRPDSDSDPESTTVHAAAAATALISPSQVTNAKSAVMGSSQNDASHGNLIGAAK